MLQVDKLCFSGWLILSRLHCKNTDQRMQLGPTPTADSQIRVLSLPPRSSFAEVWGPLKTVTKCSYKARRLHRAGRHVEPFRCRGR